MKRLLIVLMAIAIGGTLAFGQTMPTVGLKGYWKFDDAANLGMADVGNPLLMKHMIEAAGDVNKFVAITGPKTGDGAVTVGLGSYFECTPDLPASGADTAKNINKWSIAMDIRFKVAEWHSMVMFRPQMYVDTIKDAVGGVVRTGPRFNNDGDFQINPAGHIGIGASGYGFDTAGVNIWYRVVVTADMSKHDYRIYLDGQLLHVGKASPMVIDGRFSIQSMDGLNKLIFKGDNDGDDGEMDLAFIALYDRAIAADSVTKWGGYGHIIRNLDPVAQWDFDTTATPYKATVGADLAVIGKDSSIAGPMTDNAARRIASGNYYTGTSSILPNGSGTAKKTNAYAIKIDFRANSKAQQHPLYQTDSTNASGAEAYISTDGLIGNPALGYSNNSIKVGNWHRLIINANLASSYDYWLDGFPLKKNGPQTIDGQYALNPKGTLKSILFFADSATYSGSSLDVSALSVWNRSLDSAEIAILGSVPVPVTDTASGPGGYSMYGDGIFAHNQYGRLAPHADFDFDSTKSFTIECWTRALSNWSGDPSIIGDKAWTSGGNPGFVIAADAGRGNTWKFNIADEYRNRVDINMDNDPLANLNDAKWHHIAVVVDRSTKFATTYQDGKFIRSSDISILKGSVKGRNPANPTAVYPLCFNEDGTETYDPDAYVYGGYLDEIRIWKGVALDSLTLRAWKNKSLTNAHPNYANLVGYWTFEEGKGSTSADRSGHGHAVTLINGAGFRTSQALTAVAATRTEIPLAYALDNAFPNPFNPSTTIRFSLPVTSTVRLVVYNLLGQQVATLVNGTLAAGQHQMIWNSKSDNNVTVASGVYYYRIDAASPAGAHFTETRKVVLVK